MINIGYLLPNSSYITHFSVVELVDAIQTYSKLSTMIDTFFQTNQKVFDEYKESLLRELETNATVSEGDKQRVEEIQRNRVKSNNKKKIANGRICSVNCIESNRIVKGYLVVFRYYNIKLYLGPFKSKDTAEQVRADFRKELFNLRITKRNYKNVIDAFYSQFKTDIENQYNVMTVYHKNNGLIKEDI